MSGKSTNRSISLKNNKFLKLKGLVLCDNESNAGGKKTFYNGHSSKQIRKMFNISMKIMGENSQSNYLWNGKKSKFTKSFHNQMYKDTGINSISLRFRRDRIKKHRLEVKEKEKIEIFNEMKRKNMIAKFFQSKFGVHAKFSELRKFTQTELERKLLLKGLKVKKIKAAIKIQSLYRMYKARTNYKRMLEQREKAGTAILRAWKRYRMITMIPKVMKERK